MKAIYKAGGLNLQTHVVDGICAYTDEKTPAEYLKELGPEFMCIPLEDAIKQITEAEEKTYIKPWEEITEEQYDYWLNVLPPQKWLTVGGVSIFRMIEFQISNITLHVAKYEGRYFSAHRRTTTEYDVMAEGVRYLYNTTA